MGKTFNIAGGMISNYDVSGEKLLQSIEVTLKEGESNQYYLHDKFNLDSVNITIHYTDGSTNTSPTNYVYYPADELDTSDLYITFKAVEGGRIVETLFRIYVLDYQLVPVPYYTNTLIYTEGKSQSPTWIMDDSIVEIVGGNSVMTLAGTYKTTFGLIDKTHYRWDIDPSEDFFADLTVEWTIEKRDAQIRVIPPFSNQEGYVGSYEFVAHEGDLNMQFSIDYPGSPTGGFSTDIDNGHILLIKSSNFNNDVIIMRQFTNKILEVDFNLGGEYKKGETFTLTIRVNPSSFPNYNFLGDFVLTFVLLPVWSWGSPSELADKYWFLGMADFIRRRSGAIDGESFIGQTKRVQLSTPVLGTMVHDIVCTGYDNEINNYGFRFNTLQALNEPLKPNYGSSASSSDEYPDTIFLAINNQYYDAFPGKNYIVDSPTAVLLGGYPSSELKNYQMKVVTPAAYQLGLVIPDMDTSQTDQNEPYQGDYNGTFANVYFIDNSRRQKETSNMPGLKVKYWTRSTAVKCVTPNLNYIRNFIICNEDGTYQLVDARTTDLDIYHSPMFKIGSLQVR